MNVLTALASHQTTGLVAQCTYIVVKNVYISHMLSTHIEIPGIRLLNMKHHTCVRGINEALSHGEVCGDGRGSSS